MKFYFFNQNNSGGSFDVTDKLCHRVIIEASNVDEAIDIAENMGIYFDGCATGSDCECCGDRWYRPDDGHGFPYAYGAFELVEAEKTAEKYNCKIEKRKKSFGNRDHNVIFETVEQYAQYMVDYFAWTSPDVRIFYKNGEVKEFYYTKK